MPNNIKKVYKRSSELTGGAVAKLIQEGRDWTNEFNKVGFWIESLSAYEFEYDIEDGNVFDATKRYEIHEGTDLSNILVLDEIDLASITAALEMDAHEAETITHGATGAIVGTTNTQTLTAKTINGANNTLEVKPSQMKASSDSALPAIKVQPAGGTDTLAYIDTSDINSITMRVADAVKSVNKNLNIIASQINLSSTGSDIVLRGVASPVNSNDAVPKSITDALEALISALMVGGIWTSPPNIVIHATNRGLRRVQIDWFIDAPHNTEVARWELYWTEGALAGYSAGALTDEQIIALRAIVSPRRIIADGRLRMSELVNPIDPITALIIGFDTTGEAYCSDEVEITPQGLNYARLEAGSAISIEGGNANSAVTIASDADDAEADDHITFQQTDVTFKVKWQDHSYCHSANTNILRCYYRGYCITPGQVGFIKLAVVDSAGNPIKTAQVVISADVDMPSTNLSFDLDVSSGLTAGQTYRLQVSLASDAGATTTYLLSDIKVIPVQNIPVY